MEFFQELWHNQPNSVIGVALAILVLLEIYIKLIDMEYTLDQILF